MLLADSHRVSLTSHFWLQLSWSVSSVIVMFVPCDHHLRSCILASVWNRLWKDYLEVWGVPTQTSYEIFASEGFCVETSTPVQLLRSPAPLPETSARTPTTSEKSLLEDCLILNLAIFVGNRVFHILASFIVHICSSTSAPQDIQRTSASDRLYLPPHCAQACLCMGTLPRCRCAQKCACSLNSACLTPTLATLISLWKWETDFCTPPVVGGAAAFDNSAPAVYKIQGPSGTGFVYTDGAAKKIYTGGVSESVSQKAPPKSPIWGPEMNISATGRAHA